MKSIVLCERTLESENFGNLKEERINEKTEEKKVLNGVADSKKSESDVDSFKKDGTAFQNGDRSSKTSFKVEVTETDEKKPQSSVGSDDRASENCVIRETDTLGAVAKNSLCGDADETDCSLSENLSSENKMLENLEAQNSSELLDSPNLKNKMDLVVENDEMDDEQVEVKQVEKLEDSSQVTDESLPNKSFDCVAMEGKEFKKTDGKQNVQPMEGIILDIDENKENVKENEKANGLENYSGSDLTKHANGCEIQVGEVQTISGAEKDSMWNENDLKKCEQDLKEKSEEYECHDITTTTDDSMNTVDESHEAVGDDSVISEAEENIEEGMHIEVEESEQVEELKVEEKENDVTDLDNFSANKKVTDKTNNAKSERAVCRKRQKSENNDEDPSTKKKRLLEAKEETDQVQSEEENAEDSSRCESPASLDPTGASSEGQVLAEAVPTTKRTSTDDKNTKKLSSSVEKEETEIKKPQTTEAMFSVLEKFRGTLKTLTRSDLEELIVQKLCEVITERSNVGELRRKAQTLEQDQERWKIKAQSLAKQMREMEMVMKKYMTEVQKQIKEGDTHVVTPLKVTRSVGLQVSFYSSANKGPKTNMPQPAPSNLPQNLNTRNAKGPSPKLPQFSPSTQNMRNKPAPSFQKGSPSLQKSPIGQPRRPIVPKPDYSSTPVNRPVVQQSHVNNARGVHNQIPRNNFKAAAGASPQQQQQSQSHHQQQQQPHQQQNGSKVIDLTDDDDRQTGNVMVKTSTPIRVVSHLTQPPTSQNNRFAYLLPTTSATTGTSTGQSRQVLIATPAMPQPSRQIMCSMPPLLFKGGNVVQSGSQSQMLNQSNKHPAPLPKRPLNQNTRPSLKLLPPRPALKISKVQTGIVLSWNMALSQEHAPIASYQLYAYQESDSPPATSLWKKVGDVKALPLPMACTLTQFMSGHKYHFAVRAVDLHSRIGPFSFPGTIVLV